VKYFLQEIHLFEKEHFLQFFTLHSEKEPQLLSVEFNTNGYSHVTLLIKSKVPIKVISERVGHSNINTTLNIYAHTLREMDSEASVKVSESLFKLG
jgi:hypothetical protein